MRKSNTSDTGVKAVVYSFGCLFVIAIIAGITMGMGWICKLVADHFGFHQPLWIWCLIWFLLSSLFSASGSSSSKD